MKNKLLLIIFSMAAIACGNGDTDSTSNSTATPYPINSSETTVNPKEGKSVLIIEASPNKGGNTDTLADEFARGASEVGGKVEKIFLPDLDIAPLDAQSLSNMRDPEARQHDDADAVIQKMIASDVIVLSSPVWFMSVTSQLKVLIDRCFFGYMEMKDKEFYYITACADRELSTPEYALSGFRGFVMCLPNATERGMIMATGMGMTGAVKNSEFMKEAYELGKTINKQ